MPFDDLINVIETLKKRMTMYRQSLQQNETRTRTALIDPLLTALGWDVSDPGLVTPEYTVGQGRADYALIDGGPRPGSVAIVEAKSLDSFLNDRERNQMLTYANMEGVKYAILTNGDCWELYDIFKRAHLNERRLLSVKIISTPVHQLALQLLLLWRPNLTSGEPVAAQGPALGQNRQPQEASHELVDTPLQPVSSVLTSSDMNHQPRQYRSTSRMVKYCVDGEAWIQCPDATRLMLSIVEWCGQQNKDGADNYYEKLSKICFSADRPILIKEKVTQDEHKFYSTRKINGWYIFNRLPNQQKENLIDKILRVCVRQNGTNPVLGQDLRVEMPNC